MMARKKKKSKKKVVITLVRSPIGQSPRQRGTLQALGLKRIHQSIEHIDTPVLRGMVNKVSHLVKLDE